MSSRVRPLLAAALAITAAPQALVGQADARMQASRQIGNESELTVSVEFGAGEFELRPADPGQLYRMQLRYDEEAYDPVHELSGNQLSIGVDGRDGFNGNSSSGELRLALSDRIPMDLDLELGAVRTDIELGGLRLRSLELSTGASETDLRVSTPNPVSMTSVQFEVGAASFEATDLGRLNAETVTIEAGVGEVQLDFGGLQRPETRVSVEMGLGRLEIRIPIDVGIYLTRSTFLVPLEAPGLVREGEAYVSPGWEASPVKVYLDVDAAFGALSILRGD